MKHTLFAFAVVLTTLATGCQTAPKKSCCALKAPSSCSVSKTDCSTKAAATKTTSCCPSKAKR